MGFSASAYYIVDLASKFRDGNGKNRRSWPEVGNLLSGPGCNFKRSHVFGQGGEITAPAWTAEHPGGSTRGLLGG